ncbi:MAG: hypothetical protein KBS91_03290 [Firmicutes bacterium]|nr:hypothetical protein [Candidatus Caballimonas caccae]
MIIEIPLNPHKNDANDMETIFVHFDKTFIPLVHSISPIDKPSAKISLLKILLKTNINGDKIFKS